MPEAADPPSPAMHQAFSAGSQTADQTLAALVRVASAALAAPMWAGEVDLHRVAVIRLLPALLRRQQCTIRLVALPEWQQITSVPLKPQPVHRSGSTSIAYSDKSQCCKRPQSLSLHVFDGMQWRAYVAQVQPCTPLLS